MDGTDVQRRIAACFAGRMQRSCSVCSAASRCCFGERFDPDDEEECGHCIHQEDCCVYSEQKGQTKYASRRSYVTASSAPSRSITVRNEAPLSMDNYSGRNRIGEEIMLNAPFELFMRQSMWKALEGFFLGAYEFVKRSRIW